MCTLSNIPGRFSAILFQLGSLEGRRKKREKELERGGWGGGEGGEKNSDTDGEIHIYKLRYHCVVRLDANSILLKVYMHEYVLVNDRYNIYACH